MQTLSQKCTSLILYSYRIFITSRHYYHLKISDLSPNEQRKFKY